MESRKYTNFTYALDADQHGILTIDLADKSTNVLTREVLEELQSILGDLEKDQPRALLIQSAKKNGFVAGANIHEFTQISSDEEALALIKRGQDVFSRLESLPFPTVSLIHGFCLGGGLELALACTYRVAADEPSTRIGLPEVRLGIHPGFGGTVRLIRLIGAPTALPLMLTGRSLKARQAEKLGVVSHAVPARVLMTAAKNLLEKRPKQRRSFQARLAGTWPGRRLLAWMIRKKTAEKVSPAQYPAPFALIDLWQDYGGSFKGMMEAEARSVARLIRGETAQNLIRAYLLQEQLKGLAADTSFKAQHVHVIGAGVMGGDIAAWCALRGLTVTIQDNSHEALAKAVKRAAKLFQAKLKAAHLVKAALDRLLPDMAGHGLAKADVIIEAIYENVSAKQEVLQAVQKEIGPDTLLATNTSSIPLETLAHNLERPEQLLGLHFFNPVAKMQLVEVVSTSFTAEAHQSRGIQFTKQIGKLPLPVKSSPGFLINRILMPYLHEAAILEDEGFVPEQIDQAAKNFGMPVGPVELIDLVGIDICLSVAKFMAPDGDNPMPETMQQLYDAGNLGRKTGEGYYTYTNNRPVQAKVELSEEQSQEITDRLILRLINESVACLREEVVANENLLDAGMIFGTGFAPFRGGPMHYLHTCSAQHLFAKVKELAQHHGERFTPDPGWDEFLP